MGLKSIIIRGGDQAASALDPSLSVAGARRVFHIHMHNSNIATRYLQVFDAATEAAAVGTPLIVVPVATLASVSISFPGGRRFVNGCTVLNSTTAATKTLGGGDSLLDVVHAVN